MNLTNASHYRRLAGKSGALFCLIFFIAVLDALIAHIRQPSHQLDVLPGSTDYFNISIRPDIESLDFFFFQSNSEFITVKFESIQKGFWLGGKMCQGRIMFDPGIKPGEYQLILNHKEPIEKKPLSVYTVNVYPDEITLRENSKSFLYRFFKIMPWIPLGAALPLIVIAFGFTFYYSQQEEKYLTESGKAKIYRVKKSESGYEIAFGLGTKQGIQNGSRLHLLNEQGNPAGYAEVTEVFETDSFAKVNPEYPVKPGNIVSI